MTVEACVLFLFYWSVEHTIFVLLGWYLTLFVDSIKYNPKRDKLTETHGNLFTRWVLYKYFR